MTITTEALEEIKEQKDFHALLRHMREVAKAKPQTPKEISALDFKIWQYAGQKTVTALINHIDSLESQLLAAREAVKPSYWIYEYTLSDAIAITRDLSRAEGWQNEGLAVTPLFTAPPAPAVPDECPAEIRDLMASHSDALFNDDDAQQIWSACRAAMLAAAPGVSD